MKHKIIIVDDQSFPRQLLASFISETEQYELTAALTNGKDAIEYCRRNAVDLVIIDVVLGHGINGLDTAKAIKEMRPHLKIIIVTSMPEVSYISKAKTIGVESFWYKEAQEEPIMKVIEKTLAGESVYPERSPVVNIGNAKSTDFTPTELIVLREMTTGATNLEIAKHLNIEETTIKKHITNMLKKTGYRNRVELAVKARVHGLVIED